MTWPTTWDSLTRYRQKAPCGCRYRVVTLGPVIDLQVSPNRMQRCFRHMRTAGAEIEAEILRPLEGAWDA